MDAVKVDDEVAEVDGMENGSDFVTAELLPLHAAVIKSLAFSVLTFSSLLCLP
jgi:hypothetical protein